MIVTPAPRLGIVVTDSYAPEDPDHDTPILLDALGERGIDARPVVWHRDRGIAAFDLLVIRSPWDYPERLDEFQAFLGAAQRQTRVQNSPAVIRWNLDKRYLRDLGDAGVTVAPTTYCADADQARIAIAGVAAPRLVVKPTVSGGARDTGLFESGDPRALALAERILSAGGVAMVQPEIAELSSGAEKALYSVNGVFTHAIAKGPLLEPGGGLLGGVYQEHPETAATTAAERAFADAALRAVADITGEGVPLYARVDLVDSGSHGLLALEVELIEPALNLHVAPDAVEPTADGLARAVRAASCVGPHAR